MRTARSCCVSLSTIPVSTTEFSSTLASIFDLERSGSELRRCVICCSTRSVDMVCGGERACRAASVLLGSDAPQGRWGSLIRRRSCGRWLSLLLTKTDGGQQQHKAKYNVLHRSLLR